GRAHKSLIKRGINLKEVFVEVARTLNEKYDALVVEAGGHPMAAGAFVHTQHLDEFLKMVSRAFSEIVSHR
ncbi:MAG: DHHA1 domain-containing protein, partial [Candidatus Thorarchaeota archaeon]